MSKQNGFQTPEDPLLGQLERDCFDMLEKKGNVDQEKAERVLALVGLQVIYLRRNTVTRLECIARHRPLFNWSAIALAVMSGSALAGVLLQLFGVL